MAKVKVESHLLVSGKATTSVTVEPGASYEHLIRVVNTTTMALEVDVTGAARIPRAVFSLGVPTWNRPNIFAQGKVGTTEIPRDVVEPVTFITGSKGDEHFCCESHTYRSPCAIGAGKTINMPECVKVTIA